MRHIEDINSYEKLRLAEKPTQRLKNLTRRNLCYEPIQHTQKPPNSGFRTPTVFTSLLRYSRQ